MTPSKAAKAVALYFGLLRRLRWRETNVRGSKISMYSFVLGMAGSGMLGFNSPQSGMVQSAANMTYNSSSEREIMGGGWWWWWCRIPCELRIGGGGYGRVVAWAVAKVAGILRGVGAYLPDDHICEPSFFALPLHGVGTQVKLNFYAVSFFEGFQLLDVVIERGAVCLENEDVLKCCLCVNGEQAFVKIVADFFHFVGALVDACGVHGLWVLHDEK